MDICLFRLLGFISRVVKREQFGARFLNTSSPCWIGCFYRTILGAEGMLPTGAAYPGGMPYDALGQAWEAPFASSDPSRGGCPSCRKIRLGAAARLWP